MTNDGLLRVRVAGIRADAVDVRAFDLVAENGGPGFRAGAHIDVAMTLASGEATRRSYSIASPPEPAPAGYLIGVLKEKAGTGGSEYMHEQVQLGDILETTHPKNFFELAADGEHSVLIAGGIGITPILAMAHELSAGDASFELHYAAQTPDRMAFRKTAESFGDRARLYFDGGDPARGVPLRDAIGAPDPGRHVYVCGPKGMIEAVRQLGRDRFWPEDHVHFEVFLRPKPHDDDGSIEVVIHSTGETLMVPPDKPILDVLLEAGVDSDYDCRMGICGTCAVRVLEGEPDHRDSVLSDSEHAQGMMCTCVSRAKSGRLVLDH